MMSRKFLDNIDLKIFFLNFIIFVDLSGIADRFQTNHASELRNILRTVFFMHDLSSNPEDDEDEKGNSAMGQVTVQMGQFSNDINDTPVEEGIDACLDFLQLCDRYSDGASLQDLSPSQDLPIPGDVSPPVSRHCDNFEETATLRGESQTQSSVPSIDSNGRAPFGFEFRNGRSNSEVGGISVSSSSSSLSSGQNSSSIHPNANLPTMFVPGSNSMLAHSIVPISDDGAPQIGSIQPGTNLLNPPAWIPDELVNTCFSCSQTFNLIRRRHHCRRCGYIFCHQCCKNFVFLRCFGYNDPVRVCNQCLTFHQD